MGIYPHLVRLTSIIDTLSLKHYSKKELKEKLEDGGFEISNKTIERDFMEIKSLGYDLTYSHSQGYYIENGNTHEIEILNKVKDQMSSHGLHQFITEENTIQSPLTISSGILQTILKSITNRISNSFIYKKYGTNDKTNRVVAPLVLKEYNGQWHLLAYEYSSNSCKTFGCDRINFLKVNGQFSSQLIDENKNQITDFKTKLGASMPLSEWLPSKSYFQNSKSQIITLEVSESYLGYLTNNPVHYTQRISKKDNDWSIVTYNLIPNLDLIKFILSQVGDIKVIEPVNLKKFIRKQYKNLIYDIT
jgi:predicted DNA-binding transcriptional regulator YafY